MSASRHYINSFAVTLPGAIGAAAIATPVELPRDGFDVEFTRISIAQVQDGEVVPANCTIQIFEQGGTNSALFVQPQHARNIAGDGSLPWELAEKFRVSGNVRLSLSVVQLGNVESDVYVTLHGRRVQASAQ
ncbi:hypothetical protein [Nevskia ramosa]|uniref:hypothetical protein n=1 Tax=Nevskia ramosa TaxID=64002 RepID=UPI0003B67277|nr:hypothetical protein [Nevskia ramosa]